MCDSDKRNESGALSITGTATPGRVWSITINNPTEQDMETWKNATSLPFVKKAVGQLEKGENGTPHIQGYLRTDPVRHSQVKKAFPRAHIEKARNPTALEQYCVKEETRVARIDQTEIATPQKVQTSITEYVKELLTEKGNPVRLLKTLEGEGKNQTIVWKKRQMEWEEVNPPQPSLLDWSDSDSDRLVALVKLNKEYVQANADSIIDTVVENLIESGYMTVEFVMSNNQVRQAYKRYLSSIVIRNVKQASRQEEHSPSSSQAIDSTPEEVD